MGGKGIRTAHQEAVDKVRAAAEEQTCTLAARREAARARARTANHPYCTPDEQRAAANAVRHALAAVEPPVLAMLDQKLGSGQHSGDADSVRMQLVEVVLRAIAQERHGQAEGSLARDGQGSYASRYYSDRVQGLAWLINEGPVTDSGITVDAVDQLPDGWQVAVQEPWRVVL